MANKFVSILSLLVFVLSFGAAPVWSGEDEKVAKELTILLKASRAVLVQHKPLIKNPRAEAPDIHREPDARSLLVRYPVTLADHVEYLLKARCVKPRGEGVAGAQGVEDAADRGSPDVGGHRSPAELSHHQVSAGGRSLEARHLLLAPVEPVNGHR